MWDNFGHQVAQPNSTSEFTYATHNAQLHYWHPSLHKAEEAHQSVHWQLHTYSKVNDKTATQPQIIRKSKHKLTDNLNKDKESLRRKMSSCVSLISLFSSTSFLKHKDQSHKIRKKELEA